MSNSNGETLSSPAELKVEDPNDPNIVFKRNFDLLALPYAPTQPTVLSITSDTILLTWQPNSYTGHSSLVSYRIEYYSPELSTHSLGWTVIADNIPSNKKHIHNYKFTTGYVLHVYCKSKKRAGFRCAELFIRNDKNTM